MDLPDQNQPDQNLFHQRLLRTHGRLLGLQALLGVTLFLAAAVGGLPRNPLWMALLGAAVLAGVAGERHVLARKTALWEAERSRLEGLQRELRSSRDETEASRSREQAQYREAARALATIRSSSQNLVLIGEDLHIRLLNGSMQKTLQARLQATPGVHSAIDEALAGGHCDCLSGPMHPPLSQRLTSLTGPARWEATYGDLKLQISATRVEDAQGQFLGYAMEWRDRTDELATQAEIAALVHRAAAGMLDDELPLDDKRGFNRDVSAGINQLLSNCRSGMQEVAGALALLAEGRLEAAEGPTLDGVFGDMQRHTRDTVHRLIDIVRHIHEATDLIQSAVREISSGMLHLAQRTDQQAREIEETAASMEQLTVTVRQNGDNAQQANALAVNATQIADRGGSVMEQVVSSMGSIRETSRRIADILGVLDSIAFQTNILAVNASVEAARAGEQGRGFAVVAAEVGKLSQRSAQAAREIRTLMTETEDRVQTGANQVTAARSAMLDIVGAVGHVATIMNDITDASAQQTLGINFINEAIAHMDSVTQQNASLVEEAAVATEALDQQARSLAAAVALFRIDGSAVQPSSQAVSGVLRAGRPYDGQPDDGERYDRGQNDGMPYVGMPYDGAPHDGAHNVTRPALQEPAGPAPSATAFAVPAATRGRTGGVHPALRGHPGGDPRVSGNCQTQAAKLADTNSQFTRFQNAAT